MKKDNNIQVRKYLAFLHENPDELKKITAEKDVQNIIKHAKLHGFTFEKEQFLNFMQEEAKKLLSTPHSKLTIDELKDINGGWGWIGDLASNVKDFLGLPSDMKIDPQASTWKGRTGNRI